jgi:phosphoribosylformylglycinamidine synthase|tara:strand:+ start:550 stop:2751 length:2202 start_codon:yes stop_codon:yes gene_type:complete
MKNELTQKIIQQHGLSEQEFRKIKKILGRVPNLTELGIFSVMWSEHCSYKSSKKWLQKLPTKAPWVICGPGENAGIVDAKDNDAIVFKMESHNHPSFIEPFQGAATGVGGILRDVFTMGARPIANMNVLKFGSPNHKKTKHLVSGVAAGIGNYGNCVGIPTVGGECEFHESYNGNILVNAMTVGLAKKNKIFYSKAKGKNNPVVYVGSKTGRDGIHGATMASAEFDDAAEEKRPTVQVGDPFVEKLLLEACLELMKTNAIVAIQDMGAAGFTSSSFEMASKGNCGIEINLDKVPLREKNMTPYEIMLSESQERMLMVIKSGHEKRAQKIFKKWELEFSVVGHLTDSGKMVLRMNKQKVADLPIKPLVSSAPVYSRPWKKSRKQKVLSAKNPPPQKHMNRILLQLLGSPNVCSKKWIWQQYDHMVMTDTLQVPGGDSAVVRIHGTKKAIAISADSKPRYCAADPEAGGVQIVAETWRNLTAVGATPLAITDNLNFGNPEKKNIMGQFVGCVKGIKKACTKLKFPVVSGNVSFYNETNGLGILPTPVVGGVGILGDFRKHVSYGFEESGNTIMILGITRGHIGSSLYLKEIENNARGAPPKVNLNAEKQNGNFVRSLIEKKFITSCHDISDGGIAITIAEMALAKGIGATIELPKKKNDMPFYAWLFGEDQSRYIIATKNAEAIRKKARNKKIPLYVIGKTGGHMLTFGDQIAVSVRDLRKHHEKWLPKYMGESK